MKMFIKRMLLAGLVLTAVVAPVQEVRAGVPSAMGWAFVSACQLLFSLDVLKDAHKSFSLARAAAIQKNEEEHERLFYAGVRKTWFGLGCFGSLGLYSINRFLKS